MAAFDTAKIDAILAKNEYAEANLLAILQDIQAAEGYLPRPALEHVAKSLGISIARIYSMATFYKAFSLKPRGKHICTVCMGTACHVRGAGRILDKIEENLKIKAGETTKDLLFTVERVNCVGACAMGPVVIVDGETIGNATANKINKVISDLKADSKKS